MKGDTIFALIMTAIVGAVIWFVVALFTMRSISPSEVAVFEYRPFVFGSSSLDDRPIGGPQRFYMWPSTSMWTLNTAPQTLPAHADDFMSADRVPLDFDIAITIKLADPAKAPAVVRKFSSESVVSVFRLLVLQDAKDQQGKVATRGEFMSYLRDQVRHHSSSVFIAAQNADGTPSDAASQVEKQTRDYINKFLSENGADMIRVENIALGRANPPDGVRRSIEATAQQAQDVKTQGERKRAQDARKDAEIAAAAAERAFMDSVKLTPEQFVELQRIRAIEKVCTGSATCVLNMGGGNMPIAIPARVPTIERTGAAIPTKQ